MLDVANVPERGGKLAAPCDQEPQRSASHATMPDFVDAIADQDKQKCVRNTIAISGLLDEPEPESPIRFDHFVKQPLDFLLFDSFLRVRFNTFHALPAFDPIAIEKTPHLVDRQAHAKHLLIQKKRPAEMA